MHQSQPGINLERVKRKSQYHNTYRVLSYNMSRSSDLQDRLMGRLSMKVNSFIIIFQKETTGGPQPNTILFLPGLQSSVQSYSNPRILSQKIKILSTAFPPMFQLTECPPSSLISIPIFRQNGPSSCLLAPHLPPPNTFDCPSYNSTARMHKP